MFVCAFGSLTLQNCPLWMMLCTSVHLSWVISKPLQNDEHRKETESQGYQFLVVSSCATQIHPGWRKGRNQKPQAKKLKKKKISYKCNWMCGWFVVFQCCFDGYFMLLELKSPRDTNNFSFQFIRSLVCLFFSYFFAGVVLGWAERGHFLLLVTFTLGLPPPFRPTGSPEWRLWKVV